MPGLKPQPSSSYTLVGLPEAPGHQGPRKAPVPQKTALGWGTAGEEEADLYAWESLSHSAAGFLTPGGASCVGRSEGPQESEPRLRPLQTPQGASELGLRSGDGHL